MSNKIKWKLIFSEIKESSIIDWARGRQAKSSKNWWFIILGNKTFSKFFLFLCFWPADMFIWLIISWVNRHIQVQRCLLWLADYKMPKKLKVAGCVQQISQKQCNVWEYYKPFLKLLIFLRDKFLIHSLLFYIKINI